ncbi:PREDICTED: classical arabinogalactan protein 26 [Lupinus angustifolius]|uniref:classical arabinogalactan protein 26 n=1 Tax=Lupinus angustifolius TaxID=3871 RepID=UPI00092EEF10|nr:PREDICTED: classical arabinogalactan protein 26 [Lupinus angustifolius]
MASFCLLLSSMFMALIAFNCSLALASIQNMHVSTISAAPTVLSNAPLASPTLSPDIEPLFPTPGGDVFSPSESSLPTIPSSPSPPNIDVFGNPGSVSAFPPSVSTPAPAPFSKGASLPLYTILHLGIMVICMMQLHGM